MKRLFVTAALLLVMLSLVLGVAATEAGELPVDTAPVETLPADTVEMPSADEIKQDVLDTINKIDWTLKGVELWEEVKDWTLNHLSTVVGAISAILTLIIGIATKFSFVPKVISSFNTLGAAVKAWYTDNVETIKGLRQIIEEFQQNIQKTTDEVARQSAENSELRHSLDEALKENKELKTHYIQVESALLEAALLDAQQHQRLVQLSSLSCADLDAEYEDYKARVAAVKSLLEDDTAGTDGAAGGEGGAL